MTDRDYGPFNSEDDARTPAVRAIYEASAASNRRGVMDELNFEMLTGACQETGVELGDYDRRILSWLSEYEPQTCAVIAGIIMRAGQRKTMATPPIQIHISGCSHVPGCLCRR